MNAEQERQLQIDEARRLAGQPARYKPTEEKKSVRLRGHEAFLDALKANKTECEFKDILGVTMSGTIEYTDEATVSLKESETGHVYCFFKSNLICFRPLTNSPKSKTN